ncbi:MAG TPA: DUF378 domain-containing protein [Candidatus Paceibacterota bacterium]|jgi:Uncharacterized conserved protein
MKVLHTIAFILVVVGALNLGLVGAGGWDVLHMLLGKVAIVERIVYILVGLSAILLVFTHKQDCKSCSTSPVASQPAM